MVRFTVCQLSLDYLMPKSVFFSINLGTGTGKLGNKRTSGDLQQCWDKLEPWEESWRLQETCCHSVFCEKSLAYADVKNSNNNDSSSRNQKKKKKKNSKNNRKDIAREREEKKTHCILANIVWRRKNKEIVAMAWIDYKKRHDMIPQTWIIQCLKKLSTFQCNS